MDVESMKEDLEMIAESARLIVEVKEQLIGQAREQKPRLCMPADVVQSAAVQRGVPVEMLEIQVAPDAPMALADTTQLTRAFGNLLQNALEANASHIEVQVYPAEEKGFVAVDIQDDGAGIPPEAQEKIWTTFYSTKGPEHHGLGLPAALHIVTQLQGRMTLESSPGEGTTVHVELPEAAYLSAEDISGGAENILLLDDDDQWANFFGSVVVSAGKVVTHRSGEIRIDGNPDLVLVDEFQLR